MPQRKSIPNGYTNRPPTRIVPPSYQPEPIPMMMRPAQPYQPIPIQAQNKRHSIVQSNSFKNNRVAPPPPMDYNQNFRHNNSYDTQSSMRSIHPLVQSSYRQQPPSDMNYSNQQYYQQNNHTDIPPDDNFEQNGKSTSCWSKPLCLGLTRLSGGVLFGTMIILSVASLAGLITSVVLYVHDMTTDPQWKILGMVVCSIMLLTVLVTLCIFIYCYKKGHIVNSNNNNNLNNLNNNNNMNPRNNVFTPEYNNNNNNNHMNQDYDYRQPYNSQNRSPIPYGMIQNVSPTLTNDDIVRVHDKATNTEVTISPLRPRDIRVGVWEGRNAYGGIAYRPLEQPRMVNRFIQVNPSEVDQIPMKQKNPVMDIEPKTIVRLPANHRRDRDRDYQDERHSRRVVESDERFDKREENSRKSRKRRSEESIEHIELPKKGASKQRYKRVSVKHVSLNKHSDSVNDDFPTDHFYQ